MTKNEKIIAGILVGGALIGLYMHMKKMKEDKAKTTVANVIENATILERTKFTPAFNEDYKIVLSTAKQTAAVKAKSEALTASRYAIVPSHIKPPVRL